MPTHYRCYHDRQETPLGQYIDRLTIDTQTILDRTSTDIAADNCQSTVDRDIGQYINRHPRKTHDPINLLWDSLLSKRQCLAICRGEMYAALLQLGRPRVLVWMVIELGPVTPKVLTQPNIRITNPRLMVTVWEISTFKDFWVLYSFWKRATSGIHVVTFSSLSKLDCKLWES